MKKNVFLVAVLLALMVAVLPAQTDDSGGTPGLKFTLPKGGKGYSVEKGKVKTGAVVIPESYNNLPVITIAKKAFSSSTITSITIPNSITDIGDGAFKSCKNLTDITIPDSVTTMGKEVFDDCTSLTGIIIPNSVTSIGKQAFKGCKSLTSVTIPNGVTSIESGTFDGCTSLASVTIGNGVTNIWDQAFINCKSLTSITIPSSVTSIGTLSFGDAMKYELHASKGDTNAPWVFGKCESLTAINVDAGNTTYSSQDGVLYNKNKTVLLRYPEGKKGAFTIPNSVTSIGHNTFIWCTNLTSITIPNNVTSIGDSAFRGCDSLTSVTFSDWIDEWDTSTFGDVEPYPSDLRRVLSFAGTITREYAGTYTREKGGKNWHKQ